jgi:hypothetical protein
VKVKFLQSGGFTGLTRATEIDSSSLPEAEAKSLASLQELQPSDQTANSPPRGMADVEIYNLELSDPARVLRLEFSASTLPAVARPLIQFLRRAAHPIDPRSLP